MLPFDSKRLSDAPFFFPWLAAVATGSINWIAVSRAAAPAVRFLLFILHAARVSLSLFSFFIPPDLLFTILLGQGRPVCCPDQREKKTGSPYMYSMYYVYASVISKSSSIISFALPRKL